MRRRARRRTRGARHRSGADRRPARRDARGREAGRSGRVRHGCRVLVGLRRGGRRRAIAGQPRSTCARSSGRPWCGARTKRRSPARPSGRSATRSSAMRRMRRSPEPRRSDKHRSRCRLDRVVGRARTTTPSCLAHHYVTRAPTSRLPAGLEYSELSGVALAAVRQAGNRALRAARVRGRRSASIDALSSSSPADDPTRARLQLRARTLALLFSEARAGDELLAARDAFLELGDREGVTETEVLLAELSRGTGKRERFEKHVAAVQALAGELSSSPVKARALLTIADGLQRPRRA